MTVFSRDHKVIGVQYAVTARVVSADDFTRWLASQKQ